MVEEQQKIVVERHDPHLVLDVRSNERVVVVHDGTRQRRYPDHWETYTSVENARIGGDCVVIVDQVDLSRRAVESITKRCPRLIGFVIGSVEHEKSIRRSMKALHPWSDLWDGEGDTRADQQKRVKGIWTHLGKMLITPAYGRSYDRDRIVDMRPGAVA